MFINPRSREGAPSLERFSLRGNLSKSLFDLNLESILFPPIKITRFILKGKKKPTHFGDAFYLSIYLFI